MKVLVFSLSLLLIFACGEALECSYCVSPKPGGECTATVETCVPEKDACARADFLRPPNSHFRKCMKMTDCEQLKTNAFIKVQCCDTNHCNA